MSDELRAAAERLRAIKAGTPNPGYGHPYEYQYALGGWFVDREKISADQLAIVDAYLADHPADDGEAVTVEWLRSVGFRSWDGDEDEFELYLRIRDEISWECRLAYQANGIYAVRMCDTEDVGRVLSSESVELLNTRNTKPALTRGDVRRLCAALGVTLTESEVVR